MSPDEQAATADRWSPRRLRNGTGSRRRLDSIGGLADTTPVRDWKLPAATAAGGIGCQFSARKLGAELWRQLYSATDEKGGRRYGLFGGRDLELSASLPNTKFESERITKWDICYSQRFDLSLKRSKEIANGFVAVGELRKRINYSIKKLDNRRASAVRTEHPKVACSLIKNLADVIKTEKEKCRRMNIANSKLLSHIANTRSAARKLVQSLEREKKARKLLQCACHELAKLVEGRKAEIAELRSHREEVEGERRRMHIAEVWKEEHAQMKLVDAKSMLEDKCAEMNSLINDVKTFLRPNSAAMNVMSTAKASGVSHQTELGEGAVDQRRNPHVLRAMKGHIVWPRGFQRHHNSATKHLEAKLESQRMLMRNVLKQC